jgi:NAD-dependent DNA ligase
MILIIGGIILMDRSNNLNLIISDLRNGSIKMATSNTGILNQYSMELYNKTDMSSEDIQDLDTLIRICNILYNQTDLDPLPIDDGLYDLLLEKYRKYNPNFQVGSEVINFSSTASAIEIKNTKINPIIDLSGKHLDEGMFYDNLKLKEYIKAQDFMVNPIIHTNVLSKGTHNTPNEHPMLVGTLDKSKFVLCVDAGDSINDSNVKVLERDFFGKHIEEGIISPNEKLDIMLELKYDGISVEADCTDMVVSARTRGDTGIGLAQDISDTLRGYVFPSAHIANLAKEIGHPIGIKFEAIITKEDLAKFNTYRKDAYKNPRSAIVGLFGNSNSPMYRDLITLVPIEIDRNNLPSTQWNRELEIEFLNKYYVTHGCPLRHVKIHGDYRECLFMIRKFLEEAEAARSYLNFMYDGIVVSYMDERIRARLGRENHINKYSMAVKFNPQRRQTRFRGYKYTVGQDGTITPMIYYDPVEFNGTIHPKSTGNSYARFKELNLAIGDIINVEYVNDVMPRVTSCDCEPNRQNPNPKEKFIEYCPACGTKLIESSNGKQMICPNMMCNGREVSRLVNMLAKLNLKDFAEASIIALNVHSFTDIMNLDYDTAIRALGDANGRKIIDRLNELKSKPTPEYMYFGALGFTNVAQRTWKTIFEQVKPLELINVLESRNLKSLYNLISHISGIGKATTELIYNEYPFFRNDIHTILTRMNIIETKGSTSQISVRFTGIRDKAFSQWLRDKGYDADDNASVTKTTNILLVPVAGYESNKTRKAGPNTRIVPISLFMNEVGYQ